MRVRVVFMLVIAVCAASTPVKAQPAGACVKPWAIPDKWVEHYPSDAAWTQDSTFETVDDKGNPLPNPDTYVDLSDPAGFTGFQLPRDLGLHVTLKLGDPQDRMQSGFFYAINLPGMQGGADYRAAISTCTDVVPQIHFGDLLQPLGGDLKGPTIQGIADLINLDPTAYWNPVTNSVFASCAPSPACGPVSPRVVTVLAFNPLFYERSWTNGNQPILQAVNVISVFIDGIVGGKVTGYITTPRY